MHTPPSAADGHSRPPAGPSGPRPGQAPTGAQEEPGAAGLCTRLELWALEAEGLSLLPSQHFSVGSRSCFPGMEQRSRQCPCGLGTCSHSSHTPRGSVLPAMPARDSPWGWLWAGAGRACPASRGSVPPACLQLCGTAASSEHGPPRPVFCTGGAHPPGSACPQLLSWLQLGTPGRAWRPPYLFQTGEAVWERGASWES